MKKIIMALMSLVFIVSCETTTCTENCTVYNPTPYYTCGYVWDTWSGQYMYACYWVYYSQDGSSTQELDMVADVAEAQSMMLTKSAQAYAEAYSLSFEQGYKIAKNVADINALKERSVSDLADFAQKLYGVNPTELISALSNAQVGNNAELDLLIQKSAVEFNTTKENMKFIIKDLHKAALEASGISL